MSRMKAPVRPYKGKVERVALYSTSREGESLEEFKSRTETSSRIVVDGIELVSTGVFEKKHIPRYGEDRWVTKFMEKDYAIALG